MIQVAILASGDNRQSGLERRLRADPALKIAGVVPTFASLQSLLAERVVDAVIIDGVAELDSGTGREWLVELLDTIPLIVLSGSPDTWTFNQFIRAERGAILSRDTSTEQLVHAVRAACAGLLVFDAASTPRSNTGDEVLSELTPREIQVLRLLAEGLANRDIAERLGISEHTIKFHIASILGKLQASSRTEAVTRGLRSGLIEL
jgi:two-component system, NarL family, response regulator YdfI